LVALAVALEFHFQVELQRFGGAEKIDLHAVIDHQIDRHQWLDDFRVAPDFLYRAAHGGEIDHQRHAGEILQNDPCDDEGNFFVGRFFCVPFGQRLDVFAPHFFAIAIAQHRFEHDANTHRKSRNFPDSLFFQRRQRMKLSGATGAGIERLECLEFVHRHSERSEAKRRNPAMETLR